MVGLATISKDWIEVTSFSLLSQPWEREGVITEAIPVRNETDTVVIRFIKENIFSRFGCPQNIVTDNIATFSSVKMIEFCQKY